MIQSGRKKHTSPEKKQYVFTRSAKMTAILGMLVFTVFLCSSVKSAENIRETGNFGDGAYAVFAPAEDASAVPENTFAKEDPSIWTYLESVISRLVFGEP